MASIEKRGKNSWRLVVEAGYDANGKRIRRTKTIRVEDPALLKTTRKLREYLEEELLKFKIEVEAGEYIAPQKMTFSDFVEEWRTKYAEKKLAPLTLATYLSLLNQHVLPVIGHMRLDMIKPMHLVTLLSEMSRKDGKGKDKTLSARTQQYVYDVMRNVFSRACDWKLIKESPLAGVERPKVEKKEPKFYDEEEARHVIQALSKEPLMWRLLILGAMIGGFRRGELLALEWTDVNFEDMTICIRKSISLTKNGKAIVKTPKTQNSIRIVDMPVWYMAEMEKYKREWIIQKEKAADKWQGGEHQYVFHGGYGKPLYHTAPSTWWRRFTERHGLRYIRFHDLRHSAAVLLIEAGESLKTIQERLGHSRYQITADMYAHISRKVSREAANKLEKFAHYLTD